MPELREELRETLAEWMSGEDNPWTVWFGSDPVLAKKLLNYDGSNPYTREQNVTPEIMAYDSAITLTTEVYRITWLQPEIDDEPEANTSWWLSLDNGTTKEKLLFVKKISKAKRSRWHIFLKRG